VALKRASFSLADVQSVVVSLSRNVTAFCIDQQLRRWRFVIFIMFLTTVSSRWCRSAMSCTQVPASVLKFPSQAGLCPDCMAAVHRKMKSDVSWWRSGLFHERDAQVQTCCQQCDAWLTASASSAELHSSICRQLSVLLDEKQFSAAELHSYGNISDLENVGRQHRRPSAGISRHFRRSYLKANKVSKRKRTRKVEYACHFWKCTDAVYPTLS